jgi:diguanylate cyclase (GGDEF)-like protein
MSISKLSKYEIAVTVFVCLVVLSLFLVVSPPLPNDLREHGLSARGFVFFSVLFLMGSLYALWLLHRLHNQRIEEVRRTESKKAKKSESEVVQHIRLLESLALAIEAKDQTTQGHVRRTQIYATELGKKLNVSNAEIEALRFGALFHDIGKFSVPASLLNKPGKLLDSEFEKMKSHTNIAGDLLKNANFPFAVEAIARFHHESWDGTGYPKGLKEEAIPLVARIMSVVDFYDKARCNRPYREGLCRDDVIELLCTKSGTSFDPKVVETFIKHLDEFESLISSADLAEQVQGTSKGNADIAIERDEQSDFSSSFLNVETANEMALLSVLAQNFSSSLGINDTLSILTDKLRKIVPFDSCVFYLNDKKNSTVVPAHVAGQNAKELSSHELKLSEGLTGWVMENKHALNSQIPQLDLYDVKEDVASEYKSALSVPLKNSDNVFGALTLYHTEQNAYTNEHLRLLEIVSHHAANAIYNAISYEKSRETALFDTLTGLPNSRAFYLAFDQRLAECYRLEEHGLLSVISIDVDNFKLINDEHGHGVGDKLLIEISNIIKDQLRAMDFLARYGGDEFVAILPQASSDKANAVSERIKEAFETRMFDCGASAPFEIRLSVGAASYPQDGDASFEILSAANRKMYSQKQSRKIPLIADGYTNVIPFDTAK